MDDIGFSFASHCSAPDEELPGCVPPESQSQSPGVGRDNAFPAQLVKIAKRIKAVRDRRDGLLGRAPFGEPAWNILLALYVAAGERYALSVSALCAESGAPATTVSRSINRLIELNMVRRVPNPSDNRSAYIELTNETAAKLTELLDDARIKLLAD